MRALSRSLVAILLFACAPQTVRQTAVSAPSQWEPDIARFEATDRTNPPRAGSIVFVGSSSIRMWETLETDFPGLPVLNRGFGGSQLSDAVMFANRIVVPYKPRVVILYAGDNDLAEGKTPARVLGDFKNFVAIIERELPTTRLAFVAIKPSIARANIIDKIRQTNQLIRDYVGTDNRLAYVDVFTPMLDSSGQPRRELFRDDGLHMNDKGYAIWRALIMPVIR
ncbi:MAG: SGNH/GDSL hydrolase family protein [Gemmatimonadota bacterium]|nr:SGNH/GDSL hydrolase family protein [Gemmatimonadota bacterium]